MNAFIAAYRYKYVSAYFLNFMITEVIQLGKLDIPFTLIGKYYNKALSHSITKNVLRTGGFMDIRQLQCFICVAERLNFTEAAKHLYLTQSTVSQQIADLEKQLDVKLFIRNTHSVQLTAAGSVFLEEAYALSAKSQEAVKRARQTASGFAGSLKIAYLESTTQNFLPQVIKSFRKNYPNVNLHLDIRNWEELNRAIVQGDIDIGFTVSYALRNWTGILTKTIYTDHLCAVLPAGHPLASETKIDLCALAEEPFITLSPQGAPMAAYQTVEICANRGFMPNIISQPQLHEGILLMVETGMGIAVLPQHIEFYAGPGVRFVDFAGEDHYLDILAAWKKSNTNPSLSLLLNELPQQVFNRPCCG